MAAAGSGSESASMIKAIVRADTNTRDGTFTDASVSSRVALQNSEDQQRNPNVEHRTVIQNQQSTLNQLIQNSARVQPMNPTIHEHVKTNSGA